MKQRGKKSAESKLSVVSVTGSSRVSPPDDLTTEERAMWSDITATKAPEFFDSGSALLLAELCRLKTSVDLVAQQIKDFDPDWLVTDEGLKRYKVLADIRDKAQGRMNMLARSLRLTNQSRYQPVTAATRSGSSTESNSRLWRKS
jgi:hypothetical protein